MTSLSQKVLASSFLLLSARMIQRGLGLISTLVLARLLTPNDFGIVAIVSITLALFEILSTTGSIQYITQKQDISDEDLNTAWSIDILLKSLLWVLLILSTPFIAEFYDNPELVDAFYVISFVLIIKAIGNPGIILFHRALDYKKLFWLTLVQKLVSFGIVMLIAFTTPSYWAIIWGDLAAAIVMLVGSYITHSYRPHFNLSKIREQWSFSQWILFKGLLGFFRAQIDTILVSKIFPAGQLGKYHLVRGVAIMPATEIILPAVQPLLAAFAKSKYDPAQLGYQVRLAFLAIGLVIIPICVFMWNYPGPIIDVLLGNQWKNTYTLMAYFSILLFASSMGQPLNTCCIALGRVKPLFYYDLISVLCISGFLVIFPGESLEDFAFRRSILGIIFTSILFIYTVRILDISTLGILSLLIPVFACSHLATIVLEFLPFHLIEIPFINLGTLIVCYFLVYGGFLLLAYLWFYRKMKEGQHIKDLIVSNLRVLAGKLSTKVHG